MGNQEKIYTPRDTRPALWGKVLIIGAFAGFWYYSVLPEIIEAQEEYEGASVAAASGRENPNLPHTSLTALENTKMEKWNKVLAYYAVTGLGILGAILARPRKPVDQRNWWD